MPAAVRKGDANSAGGLINGKFSPDVIINGRGAALLRSTVSSHHPYKQPHVTPEVAEASKTVIANGRGITFIGAKDSCGHLRAEGSQNVFVGDNAPRSVQVVIEPIFETETLAGVTYYKEPFSPPAVAPVINATGSIKATEPEESAPVNENIAVASCGDFNYPLTAADYGKQLSPNYKLKDLSIGAVWKHKIVDQRGLKENEIACHLKLVAAALELLKVQYPGFNINSGFRQGKGKSDHEIGYAVDCQWPGISRAELKTRCEWTVANITNYQVIYEIPGSSPGWMHLSVRPTGGAGQFKSCTWKGDRYLPGFIA
jgi:uncharacterized Zn-binding protein involved in type VI secretion